MQTTIKLDGSTVVLNADCPYSGDEISWEYSLRGSWIVDQDGRQACARLARLGSTLSAVSPDDMLKTIRRHWRFYRYDAMKATRG